MNVKYNQEKCRECLVKALYELNKAQMFAVLGEQQEKADSIQSAARKLRNI